MKKIISLILLLSLMLSLCACKKCDSHVDEDKDFICDSCGDVLECTEHIDTDKNLKCDLCGENLECIHTDGNEDGFCDNCSAELNHIHNYTGPWIHDESYHWKSCLCQEISEKEPHSDAADSNSVCDICEAPYEDPNSQPPGSDNEGPIITPPHPLG